MSIGIPQVDGAVSTLYRGRERAHKNDIMAAVGDGVGRKGLRAEFPEMPETELTQQEAEEYLDHHRERLEQMIAPEQR